MTRSGIVRRPTEERAIASVSSAARPLLTVEQLLVRLLAAYKLRDDHGFALLAHYVVRRALGNVEGVAAE